MSDLDDFLALLARFEVPHEVHRPGSRGRICVFIVNTGGSTDQWLQSAGYQHVPGRAERVTGYSSFYTSWTFDADGQFELVGVWE